MNRHPLNKITIKGYKSIRELDNLHLDKLNVLIGSNGAGKSNLVSIFKMLNAMAEERFQTYTQQMGGAHTLLYYGQKVTKSIVIDFAFGANAYHCKLTATENDTLFFEEETCYFHSLRYEQPYNESILTTGRKESGLKSNANRKVVNYVLESIKSWHIYHFHDTSDTSAMKQICQIADNERLRHDASNIAAYLFLLQEKYSKEYKNIVNMIRHVTPFFDDFILRPAPINPNTIQLEWKHTTSDAYFNAHSLSDGTLRFICLATLLLQPKEKLPSTILLDEPELGLHPYAITVLANLLKSAATNTQVLVSTQSVTLVNQLTPENIIVVDRNEKESTFKRLTKDDWNHWLDSYGLGDLWEKNLIGGRP
ncbi:AAA family ATPase [Patescibacteria group bacterium]|nr:AAA family ATPase [Patescibacteria group bacterium]MBU4016495.1 AAA family ATPase [Patescibacteria group bacterium]MBU4099570.1 AAA family ATPase [Patescibacteria group bacterium]